MCSNGNLEGCSCELNVFSSADAQGIEWPQEGAWGASSGQSWTQVFLMLIVIWVSNLRCLKNLV